MVQTDLNSGLKRINYGLFRVTDFCWSTKLNLSSCYKTSIENKISIYQDAIEETVNFSFYREVSRLLSRYMLKKCWKCVFLELFLSKLCVFNLVFNNNFKTHQNSIKDTKFGMVENTKTHVSNNLPLCQFMTKPQV